MNDPLAGRLSRPRRHERDRSLATGLTDTQRDEILGFIDNAWDDEHGGWSKLEFVDGTMLILALQRARPGRHGKIARIKRVLKPLMATTVIDKSGAINQVT